MVAAFAAARDRTLPPSPTVSRAGLLLREIYQPGYGAPPLACYVVLTGPRLLVFASVVSGVQEHGRPDYVIALRGPVDDVTGVDAPRFAVHGYGTATASFDSHGYGAATFAAGNAAERTAWVHAIAHASVPGHTCVTSEKVDMLLAAARDEVAAPAGVPPASTQSSSMMSLGPSAAPAEGSRLAT